MRLTASRTALGDIAVVTLRGSVTAPSVRRFRAELDAALGTRPQAMIVDLYRADLACDTAVTVLLDALRAARAQGCRVALCGLSDACQDALALTPELRRMSSFTSVEEATQGLLLVGV